MAIMKQYLPFTAGLYGDGVNKNVSISFITDPVSFQPTGGKRVLSFHQFQCGRITPLSSCLAFNARIHNQRNVLRRLNRDADVLSQRCARSGTADNP